jgi:hypothetical protein
MAMTTERPDTLDMSDEEIKKRQRGRNLAVALAVVAFMVIVFTVTIVRLKAGVEASLGG